MYDRIRPCFESQNGIINEIENDENFVTSVSQGMSQLINGNLRTLIIDKAAYSAKADQLNQSSVIKQIEKHLIDKRVVFIHLHSKRDISKLAGRNNFIHFSFTGNQSESKENSELSGQNNDVEIALDKERKDIHYIMSWLKTVLPICYQFDPDIIVVDVDLEKHLEISIEVQSYLIRWLISLANGRIVLATDLSSEISEKSIGLILSHCKALLGYPLPIIKSIEWPVAVTDYKILKNDIRKQTSRWSNVKVCVKFPAKK